MVYFGSRSTKPENSPKTLDLLNLRQLLTDTRSQMLTKDFIGIHVQKLECKLCKSQFDNMALAYHLKTAVLLVYIHQFNASDFEWEDFFNIFFPHHVWSKNDFITGTP